MAYAKGKHSSSRESFHQGSFFTRHYMTRQPAPLPNSKIGTNYKRSLCACSVLGEGFPWNHVSAFSSSNFVNPILDKIQCFAHDLLTFFLSQEMLNTSTNFTANFALLAYGELTWSIYERQEDLLHVWSPLIKIIWVLPTCVPWLETQSCVLNHIPFCRHKTAWTINGMLLQNYLNELSIQTFMKDCCYYI